MSTNAKDLTMYHEKRAESSCRRVKAMDKPWRWRKKDSEKTIFAEGRASLSWERNVQEDQDNEAESLRCRSNLSDRLPSLLCDCDAKEEVINELRRIAEQALAGQEMERAEAAYLKQELDKALQQGEAAEKKLAHLKAAMKDCKREIESLRRQQDESIQNDFSKAKVEFEKERKKTEAKLAEANKRHSNLSAENGNLMKALICKERLLHDLDEGKAELEAELDVLTSKLDSAETENTFLKHEFRAIEKELKLRNEEIKYNCKSALENTKQINKLEAECQQLRHLVRKRLQVDVQGTDQASMRKKKLNPTGGHTSDKPAKGTSFLIERVYHLEEENTTLREILALSDGELHSWRIKYGKLASRLAELEAQFQDLSGGGENQMQLAISGFGLGKNDGICESESWADALLAELEEYRQGKMKSQPECKAIEIAEANNVVEVEKYAIVTTSTKVPGSEKELQSSGNELVLVSGNNNHSQKTEKSLTEHNTWLDEILNVILEEHRVSNRNISELLEDIKIALGQNGNSMQESCSEVSGFLTWDSSDSACKESQELLGMQSNEETIQKPDEIKDGSFAREMIRRHFGFNRSISDNKLEPGSSNRHNTLGQMIAIQSTMREENIQAKEQLQRVTEEKIAKENKLEESKQIIESLQKELDSLRDSKGLIEDQIENQRLINEDLNTQLTVAKGKLNENLHMLSSLEVELDHKNECCEELEATCLELQLELETLSRNGSPNTEIDKVAKKLFEEDFCHTTAIVVHNSPLCDKKTLTAQRSTLRDRMLEEEDAKPEHPKLPRIQENVAEQDLEKASVFLASPAPVPKEQQTPEQGGTLALVPVQKASGGFGLIKKLFLRRNKGRTKMKDITLQRNTSALMKQKECFLLV